jgi:hypothetical protein
MRTVDAWKGPMGVSALALLAALAMASGCTEKKSVEADAEVPPADAGLDATGGNGTDAQVPPDAQDATTASHYCARDGGAGDGDAGSSDGGTDDSPAACTPAACEATDGGADGDRPPWGCPEPCDPPCEGDTVCCDDGRCQQRTLHECACDDGCELELTIRSGMACVNVGSVLFGVCNRGTTTYAPSGQTIVVEDDGEVICTLETPEPIAPCTCIVMNEPCPVTLDPDDNLRLVINPDEDPPDCGAPWGRTSPFSLVGFCD